MGGLVDFQYQTSNLELVTIELCIIRYITLVRGKIAPLRRAKCNSEEIGKTKQKYIIK